MRLTTIFCLAILLLATAARAQQAADGRPMQDVDASDITQPAPPPGAGAPSPNRPKLRDVFKSLQDSTQGNVGGGELTVRQLLPVGAGVLGLIGAAVAVGQWNRQRAARPAKPAADHGKLMREMARRTGLSRRQLRQLEPLAREAGLASPLVAAITPSTLRMLAARSRGDAQRMALARLAKRLARR